MERIDIQEFDPVMGLIYLGTVAIKPQQNSDGQPIAASEYAKQLIADQWSDFQETQPDTDSLYIDFLVIKFPNLFESAEGNHQVLVGQG